MSTVRKWKYRVRFSVTVNPPRADLLPFVRERCRLAFGDPNPELLIKDSVQGHVDVLFWISVNAATPQTARKLVSLRIREECDCDPVFEDGDDEGEAAGPVGVIVPPTNPSGAAAARAEAATVEV